MTDIDYAPRVAKGAALLDRAEGPGWVGFVTDFTLDMSSAHECILGQLYGTYRDGLETLGLNSDTDAPAEHGFAYSSHSPFGEYYWLGQAWCELIQTRRSEQAAEPAA